MTPSIATNTATAMASGMSVFSLHRQPEVTHQCRLCPKAFKRAEHRNQHERSHSQVKPFACRVCSKRYARADLVTRHEKTVHKQELNSRNSARPSRKAPPPEDSESVGISNDDESRQKTPSDIAAATKDATTDIYDPLLLGMSLLTPSMSISNPQNVSPQDATDVSVAQDSCDFSFDPSEPDFKLDAFFGQGFDGGFDTDLSPSFFDPFVGGSFDQFVQPFGADETFTEGSFRVAPQSFEEPLHAQSPGMELPASNETWYTRQDNSENRKQIRAKNPLGLVFTEDIRARCLADMKSHLTTEQIGDFQLPELTSLQQCLDRYIDVFHVHFPFIHLPTLDLMSAPSPLILAICAIGALHRLERRLAAPLCLMAERVLASVEMRRLDHGPALLLCFAQPLDSPASDLAPLMIAQARLLAVFLLGFSGEPGLIRRALVGCGYISADFRLRRSVVRPRDRGQCPTEWRQWAAHESMKRYMCTCIILGNLLNIAYGINPGFSVLDECDVEIPDDDELWDATTSSQWESLTHSKPRPPLVSLGKAASMFFTDSDRVENLPRDGWSWSPFATSAVIHQVAIAVWYLTQGQQACNNVTQDTRERSRPESIRIEAALSQCRELLIRRSGGNDKAWNEEDSPLLFNACAILRVSYGRAFMIVRFLDRSLLIKDNSQDKLAILQRYHAASQKRGQFITLAVNRALEGFAIPIRAGIFLIQKTAAFKWSVEHALAAWDAALLVTKWVHAIETLQESGQATALEEKQVLQNVRHLLSEVESEHARAHSLAAALARVWANLYDDTWVWGVAPSIGWALRQLAIMYERDKAVL